MDFKSFNTESSAKTGGNPVENPSNQTAIKAAGKEDGGSLSEFSLPECLRYVELCAAKGDDIKNPRGLANHLCKTGASDAFIRAALFPESNKIRELERGAPVKFSAEPCRVCFGAKMADPDGRGYRKCEHCKNERGAATGLESADAK